MYWIKTQEIVQNSWPCTSIGRYSWGKLLGAIAIPLSLSCIFLPFRISSISMEPTLKEGDLILVQRAYLPFTRIRVLPTQRGSLVVFHSPNNSHELLVKRVIALCKDRVRINKHNLIIDGVAQFEPYVNPVHTPGVLDSWPADSTDDSVHEVSIPCGYFFALGDNRDNSVDSRYFGPIPESNESGVVRLIFHGTDWPRVHSASDPRRSIWSEDK